MWYISPGTFGPPTTTRTFVNLLSSPTLSRRGSPYIVRWTTFLPSFLASPTTLLHGVPTVTSNLPPQDSFTSLTCSTSSASASSRKIASAPSALETRQRWVSVLSSLTNLWPTRSTRMLSGGTDPAVRSGCGDLPARSQPLLYRPHQPPESLSRLRGYRDILLQTQPPCLLPELLPREEVRLVHHHERPSFGNAELGERPSAALEVPHELLLRL